MRSRCVPQEAFECREGAFDRADVEDVEFVELLGEPGASGGARLVGVGQTGGGGGEWGGSAIVGVDAALDVADLLESADDLADRRRLDVLEFGDLADGELP